MGFSDMGFKAEGYKLWRWIGGGTFALV